MGKVMMVTMFICLELGCGEGDDDDHVYLFRA